MYRYFLILLLVITFPSCLKEDLSTISDIEVNSTWIVPLMDMELGVMDLMPEDEHIVIDSDSLLHIIFREDTLKTISGDSLLNFTASQSIQKQIEIGSVAIDEFHAEVSVGLGAMALQMGPDIADVLAIASQLSEAYFPPINSNFGGTYEYDPFSDFQLIGISSGTLSLEFTNNFPIQIDELSLGLKNTINQEIITQFNFEDVASNMTAQQEVEIGGENLSNELSIVILNFVSSGSGMNSADTSTWVPINLFDEMHFVIHAYDMNAENGTIIFPDTELETESSSMQLELEQNVEISQAIFEEGSLVITYESSVNHPVELLLEIPTIVDGSSSYSETIMINNTQGTGAISVFTNLENYVLDMSEAPNELEFNYTGSIVSNGELTSYNTSDAIDLTVEMQDMEFSYVEGAFGQSTEYIENGSIDINTDFIDRFSEGVTLVNPTLLITAESNIGVPMQMDLNFMGVTSTDSIDLNASSIMVNSPSIDQGDMIITTENEFNSSNSNIVNLVNAQPENISFSGEVITNPNGNPQMDNFIYRNSEINIGFEMDIPLNIRVEHMRMEDTIALTPSENSLIDQFQVQAFVKNDFPFDADVTVVFKDSINNINLDSLVINNLDAATVDVNGDVIAPSMFERIIEIGEDKMTAISSANQAVAKIDLSSINEVSESVRIYTDYRFNLSVGIVVEIDAGD